MYANARKWICDNQAFANCYRKKDVQFANVLCKVSRFDSGAPLKRIAVCYRVRSCHLVRFKIAHEFQESPGAKAHLCAPNWASWFSDSFP